jgi:hypothetical protein
VEKFSAGKKCLYRYTPIYGYAPGAFPRCGFDEKKHLSVDNSVGKFSHFSPQGLLTNLFDKSPTSRRAECNPSHLYGCFRFIHIIHTPYYDYD